MTFNNSLCAIIGYSEMLLRDLEKGLTKTTAMKPLTTILSAAEDAAKIVHRLGEFYRPNQRDERRGPIHLNTLIEQAVALTAPRWKTQSMAAGREIQIATDLGPIPPINANGVEIREVLTNLIFNGVDALPEGGTITLRTRLEGAEVVMEVSDNGTGMTEEVRTRCLEPFFTTKGDRGTGLGLAMVFGIIQRHGGTIDLQSAPGSGTTFGFRFPIAEAKQEIETGASPATERTLHVLVVDDQPVLRQLICDYLENDLHTTETVANGEAAVAKFGAKNFDLVITDQVMPKMNGYELAAKLKALRPEVPVILLTGFIDGPVEPEPSEVVDLVVAKPISRAILRNALMQVT